MIGSLVGEVTQLLSYGFVVKNEYGNFVRVATQVRGRQTGLRVGDKIRVGGGYDATNNVYLSAWATKMGTDGQETEVPVSRDDLRRRVREAAVLWWQFWRRR